MKILHVALITPNSPQLGLRAALRSLADNDSDYCEISWIPFWTAGRLPELRQSVVGIAREMQPDLCFLQLQTPDILGAEELAALSDIGTTLSWCGDLRNELPAWSIDAAPHVDVMTFSNMRDVRTMRGLGHRAEFLNIGFSTGVFNPAGSKRDGMPPIIFLGSDYKTVFPCSPERQQMVKLLKVRFGQDFEVYGNGWYTPDNFLTESQEAEAYRACKIAINQNHFSDVERFTSDRVFRAMGSGAFCISNHWPGIEEDFEIGKHLVTYESIHEIPELIDYWMARDEERNLIAACGCAHVHQHHSWDSRMIDLRRIVESLKVTA